MEEELKTKSELIARHKKLIEEIVVSPWATPDAIDEIKLWVQVMRHPCAVRTSGLKSDFQLSHEEYLNHVAKPQSNAAGTTGG